MAFAKVLKWLAAWLTEGLEDLVEVLVVMVVKVVAEEVQDRWSCPPSWTSWAASPRPCCRCQYLHPDYVPWLGGGDAS